MQPLPTCVVEHCHPAGRAYGDLAVNQDAVTLVREGLNVAELAEAFGLSRRDAQSMHNAAIRQMDREDREARQRADWDKATRRRVMLRELQADVAGFRQDVR